MKEISGDPRLNAAQKLYYLSFNLVRGAAGMIYPLRMRYWHAETATGGMDSPARRYIDAFLSEFFSKWKGEKSVSVLDIGCGSGYLREILAAHGFSGTYQGVDVMHDQEFDTSGSEKFQSQLAIARIEDFESAQLFDLAFSNTALEHIEDDRLAVRKASQLVRPGGVQVHIVPGFWSLFLYLFHGYRQYNRRMIANAFQGTGYQAYRLGGLASFILHFFVITVPVRAFKRDIRKKLSWYPKAVAIANRLDAWLPFCSVMYAILIDGSKK